MKKLLLFLWELTKIAIIAVLIVVPIREFVFQPFFVRGSSMEPSFHSFDYLIVDEISYHFHSPHRGDVIVFRNPNNPKQKFIKRIIGLPGETIKIQNGQVFIKKNNKFLRLDESAYLPKNIETPGNEEITLKKNEYFVMGDNRPFSFDSRSWGPLPKKNIIGRVDLKLWPFSHIKHKISFVPAG